MPNLERQHVYQEYYQFSLDDFDGKPVEEFLKSLAEQVEGIKQDYPEAVALNIKNEGDGDFEVRVYELETDEQYNSRLAEEQTKAEKERARDLATLKRLQAKYPDVTIEG